LAISSASANASMLKLEPWQFEHTLRSIFSLGLRLSFWLCSTNVSPAPFSRRGMWQVAQDTPVLGAA
jgi:hypothetical protein